MDAEWIPACFSFPGEGRPGGSPMGARRRGRGLHLPEEIKIEGDMAANILLVDDEEGLVFMLRQSLMLEFPGCCVDAAYSGEEALSRLAGQRYDLIIADYRMPGFSGLDLIRGVRYQDGEVPIILITGYGTAVTRQEAQDLAVNHYFEKPFDIDLLLDTVQQILPGPDEV
jgi:DNA-binding NtrC family response regulator